MLSHADHATYFELKYRSTADPWSAAGAAEHGIYNEMTDLLRRHRRHYRRVLDVGCGEGHYTEVLAQMADHVTGIDISATAIQRASERLQGVENVDFQAFDIIQDEFTGLAAGPGFDLIVCSQVLYYYEPQEVTALLARMAKGLAADGLLLVANDKTGARYSREEMLRLLVPSFSLIHSRTAGEHYLTIAATKRPQICITIDYEGWDDPAGTGRVGVPQIEQLSEATDRLMECTEQHGGRLTLFVEVAQIDFWRRHEPDIAEAMVRQIQDAYSRGHDVELHLHPRWLVSLGATYDKSRQEAVLATSRGHLAACDAECLRDVLAWADSYLRGIVKPVDGEYRPVAFRAGAYQIQPHAAVFDILHELGYEIDSSVLPGAFADEKEGIRGFDFRQTWTTHQPYHPSTADVNLPATSASSTTLLEMPVACEEGRKLSIDTGDWAGFAEHVRGSRGQQLVAIGHSKCMTKESLMEYQRALGELSEDYAFTTIRHASLDFLDSADEDSTTLQSAAAMAYYERTLPRLETIAASLTSYNQRKIEFASQIIEGLREDRDRLRVIDFGCGTGELFTLPLADRYRDDAAMDLVGFDVDPASILRLEAHARRNGLSNLTGVADLQTLPAESFDLVCCLEVLEHLDDPQPVADRLADLVAPGGLLYLTIPNGYGPGEYESALKRKAKQLIVRSNLALGAAVKLKRWLIRPGSTARTVDGQQVSELPPIETLHVANNVHVQHFTRRRLRGLFDHTSLELVGQGNSAFLVGLSARCFGLVPGLRRCNDWLAGQVPGPLASGWYFVFTKPSRDS